MESADVLSVVVVVLLVAALWAAIPGLLAGWMLREHGRSYSTGFALGAVCGPVGLLAALALIFFDDRAASAQAARPRAFRLHYNVPVVGQLHASTVWMLAGVAAFLCTWALGALLYTLYLSQPPAPTGDTRASSPTTTTQPAPSSQGDAAAPQSQTAPPEAAPAPTLQTQQRATPGAPPQALQTAASPSANSGPLAGLQNQPPSSEAGDDAPTQQGAAQTAAAAAPPPTPSQPRGEMAAAPPKPSRAAVISELTQALAARGHRGVHPAVSGDAGTSTLTLSGATLTREAGAQLLGGRGTRDALKGAGVRVVVLINGRESWTFML